MSVAPMSRYRRKEPILGYVPKNDEKKNLVHKGLRLLTFNCCPNGHIKLNKKSSSCLLKKKLQQIIFYTDSFFIVLRDIA